MPLAQARRVAVSSLRERTMRYATLTSSHRGRAFPAFVIRPTRHVLPKLHSPGHHIEAHLELMRRAEARNVIDGGN